MPYGDPQTFYGFVGATLAVTIQSLRDQAYDAMERATEIETAWTDHDWRWLEDAGVLRPDQVVRLEQLERSDQPDIED